MAQHPLTLVFEDGRTVRIEAREEETVYAAALRHRVRLEHDCLEGVCATCKALCTRGRFSLGDYLEDALSEDERARGYTLCCQMRVEDECVLEFPYASTQALARVPVAEYAGRVAAVEQVAAGVVRLDIEPTGSRALAFLPGQYVHLRVPGTSAARSYSMANPPGSPVLAFYVKLLEAGAMSTYAAQRARAGDDIALVGPHGHFYLREPRRPILMVAGGTGLAPMLAMLEHLALRDGASPPVHLLYGANDAAEFFASEQLDALAERGVPLTLERIPVAAAPGWTGPVGHVTTLLREDLLAGGDCDAYLCGPPPMVEAARRWLLEHGLADRSIHSEKFVAS